MCGYVASRYGRFLVKNGSRATDKCWALDLLQLCLTLLEVRALGYPNWRRVSIENWLEQSVRFLGHLLLCLSEVCTLMSSRHCWEPLVQNRKINEQTWSNHLPMMYVRVFERNVVLCLSKVGEPRDSVVLNEWQSLFLCLRYVWTHVCLTSLIGPSACLGRYTSWSHLVDK